MGKTAWGIQVYFPTCDVTDKQKLPTLKLVFLLSTRDQIITRASLYDEASVSIDPC
jgi:hypothetical protein